MGWVIENSTAEKSERLVLLSLANHANAEGRDSYPSVATMMTETRLPERNVQRALRALEDGGHIRACGRAPDERIPKNRRPVNYLIVGVPSTAPHANQGCQNDPLGVPNPASRGATSGTQTKTVNREQTAAHSAVAKRDPTKAVVLTDEQREAGRVRARAAAQRLRGGRVVENLEGRVLA